MSKNIIAAIDSIDKEGVRGWAFYSNTKDALKKFLLYIDNNFVISENSIVSRPDVAASHQLNDTNIGFSLKIPADFFDNEPHILSLFDGENDSPIGLVDSNGKLSDHFSFQLQSETLFSAVDGYRDGAIRGWLFLHDKNKNAFTTGCQIAVMHRNNVVALIKASEFRPDVAQYHGCPPLCGFSFVPPIRLVAGLATEFSFFLVSKPLELNGSPVKVSFMEENAYRRLFEIEELVDTAFMQVWNLRSSLRGLLPKGPYNLYNYNDWAQIRQGFMSRLLKDAISKNSYISEEQVLVKVSILIPIYRPRADDLVTAIKSACNQTYRNLEIILVDDASGREDISNICLQFARQDSRVVFDTMTNNGGISNCTNRAFELSTGDYVVLFDHDDVMVEEAIEIMVLAATQSRAKIIYSDEDKIDDLGHYSEPNFKPNFNYRLLLSQNYICHLLMVQRTHLLEVFPMRSKYDGAQDHDLLLRLSEVTEEDEIFHVPEVLYHWRKTPQSTSSNISNKKYATDAGALAIKDHLERIGFNAKVESYNGATFYGLDLELPERPAVNIIIPYRDQIPITEACVRSILSNTTYPNYTITLVDNRSTSSESLLFKKQISVNSNISVIDFNEEFNYSRINNFAVTKANEQLILFLNNDVIVNQANWIDKLVGEISLPKVAAVGCKLQYPTGHIQHAGVILGVGGVADHAFKGLSITDPGYCARAICAQEFSAVTAACLLCHKETFLEVGGFDEISLSVAFNDVDLCLKLISAGHKVVMTPDVVLEHHESLSRGSDFKPSRQAEFLSENATMLSRWKSEIARDIYYNGNFSLRDGIFFDLNDPTAPFDW